MTPDERLALLRIVDRLEGLEIHLRASFIDKDTPGAREKLVSITADLSKLVDGRK